MSRMFMLIYIFSSETDSQSEDTGGVLWAFVLEENGISNRIIWLIWSVFILLQK